MDSRPPVDDHPLVRALEAIASALDDVADLDPTYVPTREKAAALRAIDRQSARLEGLRLDLLAASSDVALDAGARSAGVWLALESRAGARAGVRDQVEAERLARRPGVLRALRDGLINPVQAGVIVRALDALPGEADDELVAKAEAHLLAEAGQFAPQQLRILGRKVFEVVAPDRAEAREAALLAAEEARARGETRLTFRPRGDGSTDLYARMPDHVADRLRAYLDSFTAPRRRHLDVDACHGDSHDGNGPGGSFGVGVIERLTTPRRRGAAFCALLERMPRALLPRHGGSATSVVVTLDLDSLVAGVGSAELSTGGRISAAEARRLACNAGVIPAVLGGRSEILDWGRERRLFQPAQRKAMQVRDRTCRADGCDIPAAWCEAHHANKPWSRGGRTDLRDGLLLCAFHHHRAHDPGWRTDRMPDGQLRFHRRT